MLDWQKEQPEYKTGNETERKLTPVDKLTLARYAETFNKLCPENKRAFDNLVLAISNNSIQGTLLALTTMLDALCELRNTLSITEQPDKPQITELPIFKTIDVASRTITIGTKSIVIMNETVWEFIRELIANYRYDRIVPRWEGNNDNKSSNDTLRRYLGGGKVIREVIIYPKGGYKLNPTIKILNGGQIGIRKTKYGKVQSKYKET